MSSKFGRLRRQRNQRAASINEEDGILSQLDKLDKESRLNPFKLPITGSHQSIKRLNVEMKLVD